MSKDVKAMPASYRPKCKHERGDVWNAYAALQAKSRAHAEALGVQRAALEHIGASAKANRRECCKFATLSGFRLRHRREVALEALAATRQASRWAGGEAVSELQHHCERCGNTLKPGQMTVEEFKARFKVGDVVLGWSTRKRCRITAIGDERILYRDLSAEQYRAATIERVAKIRQTFIWELEPCSRS